MMEDTEIVGKKEAETPLVSVVVLAYNHLDYTKLCIESLYRYTSDVDFELITVNNGSTDGTEEYFNSLPNEKKLNFPENIGVDKAVNQGFRMAQGKYTLNLSNDIVVTSRWLSNLVACMESDDKIGMVVPVCGFSSNNQQVNLYYHTLEEMQLIAQVYNKSNPDLWEERMKLVTYTCLFRTDVQKAIGGFDEDFNPGAYDDDAISFRIRRMGYRLILAKDTYVHHFGSVTFNAEYAKNNLAQRNMRLFMQKFGVNSWVASMIDFHVVDIADYSPRGEICILGIGSSCGPTLLQIKNRFRSKCVRDVKLFYLSDQESSMPDLRSICDTCVCASDKELEEHFGSRLYDIAVVESETDKLQNPGRFFDSLSRLLKKNGQLILTAPAAFYPKAAQLLEEREFVLSKSAREYYYAFTKQ